MTDQHAVIGNPTAQSKSPRSHLNFTGSSGQDIGSVPPLGSLVAEVDRLQAAGYRSLNTTAPCKRDAFADATRVQERAGLASMASAIRFKGGKAAAGVTAAEGNPP